MSRVRWSNPFDSEAEVAALVRELLERQGWTVYPETNGWDLFAVASEHIGSRVRPGDQLGVECKLDAGTAAGYTSLLRQATHHLLPLVIGRRWAPHRPWDEPRRGPHFVAVAAPRLAGSETLQGLGVATWIMAQTAWAKNGYEVTGWMKREGGAGLVVWHRFKPETLLPVPEIVVDVPAGVPSPRTASAWKVKAVRMMLRLCSGEAITSKDFESVGLRAASFRERGWVADSGQRQGRLYVWTAADGPPHDRAPDLQWPEITAALAKSRPEGTS